MEICEGGGDGEVPDFVYVPIQWWDSWDHSEQEALAVQSDKTLDENLFDGEIVLKDRYWTCASRDERSLPARGRLCKCWV